MRIWAFILLFVAAALQPALAEEPGRISVTGDGVVSVQPDMATIRFAVVTQARSAAQALTENSRTTAQALDTVRGAGIENRDMQTSGLSLAPRWSDRSSSLGSAPQIIGYVARNEISVRVRDLDQVGPLLDVLVSGGVNQFNGLIFGLQDMESAQQKARILAVQDARTRAETYARAAGVRLGRVVSIVENGAMAPDVRFMATERAMTAAPVPVAPGELEIRASVSMSFTITQPQ